MKKIKLILVTMCVCLMSVLASCSKAPDRNYVDDDVITNDVITQINDSITYKKYSINSTFNFQQKEVTNFPAEYKGTKKLIEEETETDNVSVSYFLGFPFHIKTSTWIVMNGEEIDKGQSLKYNIQAKMYQANNAYNDCYYYYLREDGGFTIKSFGVNKPINLFKRSGKRRVKCAEIKGKWNISAEYDKNGYLVSESFETLNVGKAPDSETCFGYATYTYSK